MFPTGLVHRHGMDESLIISHVENERAILGTDISKKYSFELYVFDNRYGYRKHTVQMSNVF